MGRISQEYHKSIEVGHQPLDWSDWKLIPNLISFARIVIIIPTVLLFPAEDEGKYWLVLTLLLFAYLSDLFDGVAARRLNQRSKMGLILDPLADKLWTNAMVLLMWQARSLPLWIALMIIARDIGLIAFNELLLWRRHAVMPSDVAGKSYMVLLGLMIILMALNVPYTIYLAYFLVFLGGVTAGRYYLNFKDQL